MNWLFLISIFLIVISGCTSDKDCPEAAVIHPCECTMSFSDARLVCENIIDTDTLRRVFLNSARHRFIKVYIRHSILNYIPHEIFSHIETDSLEINNVTLTDVFDAPPTYLNSLKQFTLTRVKVLRGILWEILKPMTNLKHLYVIEMQLKNIKKDFSKYASSSIKHITFIKTETNSIKKDAFSNVTNLQKFEFYDGNLKEIRRDIFPNPFDSIEVLNFEGNSLQSLPNGIFANMSRLQDIYLNSNNLTSVSSGWFEGNYIRAQNIILRNNPIQCDCRVKWTINERRKEFYGTCVGPEKVKGKTLPSLEESDFNC